VAIVGIQFTALDTNTLRETPVGPLPTRIELPEEWEFFGFNMGTAFMFFGLFTAALTCKGRPVPSTFSDRQYGTITLIEARRAIMAARARFFSVAPAIVDGSLESFDFSGERIQVIDGGGFDLEILREKLERFAQFVEIAAQNGANTIQWS
jgi:hypothetical protein